MTDMRIENMNNYFNSNLESQETNGWKQLAEKNIYLKTESYPIKKIEYEDERQNDNIPFDLSMNKVFFSSNNSNNEDIYEKMYAITKESSHQSSNKTPIFNIRKSYKIFSIKKEKNNKLKRGRRNINNTQKSKAKHNKNSSDNIILRIKRLFINCTRKYINKKYIQYSPNEIHKKFSLLKKINPLIYCQYSIQTHQQLLELPLRQLFSIDLSEKYKNLSKDYNRNQIDLLYKKNKMKEVIELLNLTVREMYEIFTSNKIADYNLENELNKIQKEEGREYYEKYKNKAEKLILILEGKDKNKNL